MCVGGREVRLAGAEADDALALRPGAPWPWRRRPGWPRGTRRRSGARSGCRSCPAPAVGAGFSLLGHGCHDSIRDRHPRHPHSRQSPARRRPLRRRPLQGPPRVGRGPGRGVADLPRHQPPPEDGQVGGGQPAGRAGLAVLPARRLRGGPRQRRDHLLLGRGDLRPDRAKSQHLSFGEFSSKFATRRRPGAPPRRARGHHLRGGHPPAARGPRRRGPLRPDPQRDLDRAS